ncbi:MAG: histidine phosphatase family protein [Candidatus Omnitrophica bacterium]|nr:histidine phosphatase family protein [Candidatus Omnitrophota bacterium]
MKKLILIRHCETDYVVQKKYCGHEDAQLNSNGIKQARNIQLRLEQADVDKIYSSDLKRASQTADIIFPKRKTIKRKGLREIDFGNFAGLTYEQVLIKYPRVYRKWLESPSDSKIPGGESLFDLSKRVVMCFNEIASGNPNKTIAIISHGGPNRIIILKLLGWNLNRFWDVEQDAAAVNFFISKKGALCALKLNVVSYRGKYGEDYFCSRWFA